MIHHTGWTNRFNAQPLGFKLKRRFKPAPKVALGLLRSQPTYTPFWGGTRFDSHLMLAGFLSEDFPHARNLGQVPIMPLQALSGSVQSGATPLCTETGNYAGFSAARSILRPGPMEEETEIFFT